MSENHKEAKMVPLRGWFESFRAEMRKKMIRASGTTVTIDEAVDRFLWWFKTPETIKTKKKKPKTQWGDRCERTAVNRRPIHFNGGSLFKCVVNLTLFSSGTNVSVTSLTMAITVDSAIGLFCFLID